MIAPKYLFLLGLLALCPECVAQTLEKVTLQLKWLHQFQFAGYYAAIENGYYTEEGLEVTLAEAQPNKSPMMAVLDGDADYGVSTTDIVRLRSEGHPVVALAVIFQHSPLALVSSEDVGVSTIHDLAGKKVMIQDGSADLLSLLQEKQVPLDQIEFVPHDFSYQSLAEGNVQAISGYVTNEPYLLQAAGIEPLIFSPKTVGIDFYGDSLFTTEEYIKKHPDQVEAFRRASLRGWDYALDHPEEIVNLIFEKYSQRKSKAALTFEAQKTLPLIRPNLIALGHMNPKRWAHIADILQKEGMLNAPVDIEAMLYQKNIKSSLEPLLKVIGISLFCILLLAAFTYHQIRIRRQLQAEIQKRKESDNLLYEREGEYRAMVEGAPLAFIVWDTELNIIRWNKEAEKLFGWTKEEAIGRCALDLIVPSTANEKVRDGVAKLKLNSPHIQINENTTKDGRLIWCKWHNVPRKDTKGTVTEFHSIATDITKDMERQLRLELDREQALSASEAKGLLLARTSHEIRNPLNAIMGFTQLIYSDAHDKETKEMAKVIMDGADNMLAILNDLLDSAKIEAGKMDVDWKEINLTVVIQKEVKLFSQLIADQGLECQLSVDLETTTIVSDPRCLQQILSNLINNARKFTIAGGIEVRLTEEDADHISIQVIDTGIGMDANTLEKIFDPFVPANLDTSQNYGGTGLGLSLTKKLADLIGGTLSAKSKPGQGSTFELILPKAPRAQ